MPATLSKPTTSRRSRHPAKPRPLRDLERAQKRADALREDLHAFLAYDPKALESDESVERRLADLRHDFIGLAETIPRDILSKHDLDALFHVTTQTLDKLARARAGTGNAERLDALLLGVEAVRELLRFASLVNPEAYAKSAKASIAELRRLLPHLSQPQLARLAGVSERTWHRRSHDSSPVSQRLSLVLRLVTILKSSWTDEGIHVWFCRKNPYLHGHRPIDLLDDPLADFDLLVAALT